MSHTYNISTTYSRSNNYALNYKGEGPDVLLPKRAALPSRISLPASVASSKNTAPPNARPRSLPQIPHERELEGLRINIPEEPRRSYRHAETSVSDEEELEREPDLPIPTPAASPLSPNRAPKVVYFTPIPGRTLSFTPYDHSREAVRQQRNDLDWRRKIQVTATSRVGVTRPSYLDESVLVLAEVMHIIIYRRAVRPAESMGETCPLEVGSNAVTPDCRDCSGVQQAALATGNLWTNIVLTFPTSNEQLTRTLAWLSRSKTHPLDILLDFRDPDWDWEGEDTHGFRWADMEAVLRLLIPSAARRWRTFELLTDTWAPIFVFLLRTQKLGSSLENLEKLQVARCNAFARKGQCFEPTALGHHLPLFGGAETAVPRLREVILTVHIDWSTPPLANLTKLELKYQAADVMPTVAHFTQILAQCPNLEALAIVGRGPQFTEDVARASWGIKLVGVTQFTFGFIDVNYAIQLLSLFDLPALCNLSLEDVSASLRHQPPDDAGPLLDWVAAPPDDSPLDNDDTVIAIPTSAWPFPLAQLHTLALHSIHAPLLVFVRLYDVCTGLGDLRLCDVGDDAVEALETAAAPENPPEVSSTSRANILPRLQTLLVRGADEELFSRVVHTRTPDLDASFEASGLTEYTDDDY
ncbi:hypothetical protein B0H16DRAFT_1458045 [Mycena metata]|uniref:F-box domain-containing protein n=1 Tax=Mycena metata TaxID=1033252 RepID=A0AAD7NDP5_9AGAR|nr:hypothetical protein B0H16DRAFT_1458045 [Mycena metata]